jgi:N-ethylmaleimide reductase
MNNLLQPFNAGALVCANRIVMAPLTRCRADDRHLPNTLMATHYAQRASAGLIVAEATMVQEGCSAFWKEPGIYNQAQIDAWREVTDAVHAADGKIVLQIWHGGRACHPDLNDGAVPVAPSEMAIQEETVYTPKGKQNYTLPRALATDEISGIVQTFVSATHNAQAAGFDGVEVHAANGYLIDQFLRDGSNQRTDAYGGSIENRARLLFDVLEAVCAAWSSDRVGLRLSPLNSFNDMHDSDPVALTTYLSQELNRFSLAYVHLMRSDFYGKQSGDVMTPMRAHYQGTLIANMGYSTEEANQAISDRLVDAVAFGVPFIANPDLPARIRLAAPLASANPDTFYSAGAVGYNDYPEFKA